MAIGETAAGLAPKKQPCQADSDSDLSLVVLKPPKKEKRQLEGETSEMKEIVAYSGILLAIFTRTMMPYWRKKLKAYERGEKIEWNERYTITSLLALITSFIIATQTIPAFILPNDPLSLLYVFIMAFGYGWGLNDAYNKILIDWR